VSYAELAVKPAPQIITIGQDLDDSELVNFDYKKESYHA
jgi:hypothetical protein